MSLPCFQKIIHGSKMEIFFMTVESLVHLQILFYITYQCASIIYDGAFVLGHGSGPAMTSCCEEAPKSTHNLISATMNELIPWYLSEAALLCQLQYEFYTPPPPSKLTQLTWDLAS